MRYHPLQELAKFGAGLIAADFFGLLWFSQSHLHSMIFFGSTVTQDIVLPAMIFDIAAFLILVHYGWNIGKIPSVRERTYLLVAGAVFTVVAIAHLYRIFTNTDLVLAGWDVPLWLSWIGVVVSTFLAYTSFHLSTRLRRK